MKKIYLSINRLTPHTLGKLGVLVAGQPVHQSGDRETLSWVSKARLIALYVVCSMASKWMRVSMVEALVCNIV